jgi:NADH:ubiquinone oxidoreductase subunit F (NADH-binding)
MSLFRIFHRHDSNEPCPHMRRLLDQVAHGKAGRFGRWYALAHVVRCTPCRNFLMRLEVLLDRLRQAKGPEPSSETLDRLMATFEKNSPDSSK